MNRRAFITGLAGVLGALAANAAAAATAPLPREPDSLIEEVAASEFGDRRRRWGRRRSRRRFGRRRSGAESGMTESPDLVKPGAVSPEPPEAPARAPRRKLRFN
jgi:hypothetical protein